MKLTDMRVRNAKPQDKPYKLSDGGGLYLLVKPNGARLWHFRYRVDEAGRKKEQIESIGRYPEISLTEARAAGQHYRDMLREGINPAAERKAKRRATGTDSHLFRAVAEAWFAVYAPKLAAKTASNIRGRLDRHIYPLIGDRDITDLTRPDMAAFVEHLNGKGIPAEAVKVLQTASQVFDYAATAGLIEFNPTAKLSRNLTQYREEHQPALPQNEVKEFFKSYLQTGGSPVVRLALLLSMLTATRSKSFRLGRWEDIDWERKTWFMPQENMKQSNDFLIPLSDWTIELLKELHTLTGGQKYLFPSGRKGGGGNPTISENAINQRIKLMGYDGTHAGKSKVVQHGFRSLFADVMTENRRGVEVIRKALGHTVKDKTVRAYFRAEMLQERREIACFYSDWLQERYREAEKELAAEALKAARAVLRD